MKMLWNKKIDDKNVIHKTTYTYNKFGDLEKQFDSFNNIITEYKYNGYLGGCSSYKISSGDSSVKYYIEESNGTPIIDKNDMSGQTLTMTNSNGLTTQYSLNTSKINYYEDSYGNRTTLNYKLGRLYSMSINAPQDINNKYSYNKFLLTKVDTQNNILFYVYDGYGQLFQVYLNNNLVKEYNYKDNCNYNETTNDNNYNYDEQIISAGHNSTYRKKVVYNAEKQPVLKQEKNDNENYNVIVTTDYATSDAGGYRKGELISITDVATGEPLTKTFNYDVSNRQNTGVTYSGARNGNITSFVSPTGMMTNKSVTFGNTKNYKFDSTLPNKDLDQVICETAKNTITTKFTKDKLRRSDTRLLYLNSSMNTSKKYYYRSNNNQIYQVTRKITDNTDSILTILENYSYDSNNNISSYGRINQFRTHKYKYDELIRLIREDNSDLSFTKIYTYSGGNLKTVTTYPCETLDSPPTGGG